MRHRLSVILAVVVILSVLTRIGEAQRKDSAEAAYPPSPVIKSLAIEPERQSIGDGDNWPITWADDGDLYTVYCDGKGFGGGSGQGSMSLAKIAGSPPSMTGQNIVSATGHKTGGGPEGRKASGLVMIDGVLYMWVRNLKKDGTGSSLAWSKDHAQTWTWADWSFPEVGYPVWMNASRNYEAAQDEYAYMYSPDTSNAYKTSDHILLARVPKDKMTTKDAYEFFAGMDQGGKPQWASRFESHKPVFTDPGHCYRPEVIYNPGLRRYLLCTATSGAPKWCGTDEKYLGIFDGPTPWGPWTAVKQIQGWGDEENRFQPHIPAKWISEDGQSFWLLYSCFPKGPYQFNLQRCVIQPHAKMLPTFSATTKKPVDQIKVNVEKDAATIDVSSPSGIGGGTVTLMEGKWPATVVLRLHLHGLESFAVSNGKLKLVGSVLSHSGSTKRLYLTEDDNAGERESGTEIKVLDGAGKPTKSLPEKGGYFEISLPRILLEDQRKCLELGWIDFYRG